MARSIYTHFTSFRGALAPAGPVWTSAPAAVYKPDLNLARMAGNTAALAARCAR